MVWCDVWCSKRFDVIYSWAHKAILGSIMSVFRVLFAVVVLCFMRFFVLCVLAAPFVFLLCFVLPRVIGRTLNTVFLLLQNIIQPITDPLEEPKHRAEFSPDCPPHGPKEHLNVSSDYHTIRTKQSMPSRSFHT